MEEVKEEEVKGEEEEDIVDEERDEVELMDNHLIFFEPKASQPNATRPAKQSLMNLNYFSSEV